MIDDRIGVIWADLQENAGNLFRNRCILRSAKQIFECKALFAKKIKKFYQFDTGI